MNNYPLKTNTVLLSSYSKTQTAAFDMTSSRSGKAYFRKTAQNQPTLRNVTFRFTQDEATIFMDWFKWGLNGGFLPFDIDLMTEWGIQTLRCRFIPDSLMSGTRPNILHWQYTAQLYIEEYGAPSYYPANQWLYPEYVDQREYLDTIVNTLLPRA